MPTCLLNYIMHMHAHAHTHTHTHTQSSCLTRRLRWEATDDWANSRVRTLYGCVCVLIVCMHNNNIYKAYSVGARSLCGTILQN
jgi:hypothetical protein